MSVYYDKEKGAWRFAFNRKIGGREVRATKLLPKSFTREEAEAFDERKTKELYQKYALGAQSRPKIEEAVLEYLKSDQAKALKTYIRCVEEMKLLEPFYRGRYLDELPEVCEQINKQDISTDPRYKKEKVLAPATKRKKIRMLCSACNWAYKYKKMGSSKPSDRVFVPKVNNARKHYPTRAEMLMLARFTKNKGARAVIITAFYSGMRSSEIRRADVQDGLFRLYDTKNGTMRFVPINPKLNVYLWRFPEPCTYDELRYWVDKARPALGLERYRFHDLRHSTASEMINQDVDLYTVGKVLGHKSVASTSIYTHLLVGPMRKALSKVGRKAES